MAIDRCVLYTDTVGVPWNGVTSLTEDDQTHIDITMWQDGQKFLNSKVLDSFSGNLKAYTYPAEFEKYDGYSYAVNSSEKPQSFGLSYRVKNLKNDSYILHLLYNVIAIPKAVDNSSIGINSDANEFEWDLASYPKAISGASPSSHLYIDSSVAYPEALLDLENRLYGEGGYDAYLPDPNEVISIFEGHSILQITDFGDGTWEAKGSDDIVTLLDSTTFQIAWASVNLIDEDTYTVYSL